jgi:acyl-CoA thioesterase FadM
MSNHLFQVYQAFAVTAEMKLRFRRPVPLDCELRFASRLERRAGKVWELAATCATVAAPDAALSTAQGRFLEVPPPAR